MYKREYVQIGLFVQNRKKREEKLVAIVCSLEGHTSTHTHKVQMSVHTHTGRYI